jgi:ATP-binding protein involved in chromosome partitioning
MTIDAVQTALRAVREPVLGQDVVSLGLVKDLKVEDGRVSCSIHLPSPAPSVRDAVGLAARSAVEGLPGVNSVDIVTVTAIRSATAPERGGPPLPGVKNVIAVGAGKGGVGKTTVSVNLAMALSQMGARVGILDGDIYGPNVPIMLGLSAELESDGQMIRPAEKYGLQVVSIGFMTGGDAAVIWRGPMLHSAVQQFFRQVAWTGLDYLIIDMPPGTGDVALSMSQTIAVAGAVVVTTPQRVSLADSRRAVAMYRKLNVPPIGIVENMSYYTCPNCGVESDIFGHGGGEQMAGEMGVPFLGRLPVYEPIRVGSDAGIPIVIAEPQSPAARAFVKIAENAAAQVAVAAHRAAAANKGKIPLMPVR